MKLSVIVTVYNLGRYIDATLAAALAQRDADVEIIVVDDASTDDSVARIEGHDVTLVRNARNLGVLRSTVEGIARASGDVLCFLDGDDLWEPGKLQKVRAAFEADPRLVLLSHDCSTIDSYGAQTRPRDPAQAPTRRRSGAARSDGMRRSILEYRGEVWLGSAWSIRSAALDRSALASWVCSLPQPERIYQDHPLATLLLLTNPEGRLDYLDEPLLQYRIHDANCSGTPRNLKRARTIAGKGWATRNATLDLVREHAPHDAALIERQALMLREYDYLIALYWRDVLAAAGPFSDCLRGIWSPHHALKEVARLGAVTLLGPEHFLALRARSRP